MSTGIVSIKYELSCRECKEELDYIFTEGNQIIGLRCSVCGREWRII